MNAHSHTHIQIHTRVRHTQHGQMDATTAQGMDPAELANLVVDAVGLKKHEIVVADVSGVPVCASVRACACLWVEISTLINHTHPNLQSPPHLHLRPNPHPNPTFPTPPSLSLTHTHTDPQMHTPDPDPASPQPHPQMKTRAAILLRALAPGFIVKQMSKRAKKQQEESSA